MKTKELKKLKKQFAKSCEEYQKLCDMLSIKQLDQLKKFDDENDKFKKLLDDLK